VYAVNPYIVMVYVPLWMDRSCMPSAQQAVSGLGGPGAGEFESSANRLRELCGLGLLVACQSW
jgi:hypothetical protein